MNNGRARLPRWVRVADFAALLLILVGVVIALSGGFRTRLLGGRVALTSPYRIFAVALAIIAVRQLFGPREPALRTAADWIRSTARSIPFRTAAAAVVFTRIAALGAGYLAVVMFGYPAGVEPFRDFKSEVLNLQLKWDAAWYLQIATSGYSFLANATSDLQQNVVFFPGYPLVVRLLALLGGNGKAAYVVGGTLGSIALLLVALTYLHRLAADLLDDRRAAAAVWLMAAYPFAYFFSAIYTESLFLASALGAFHHFRRRELAPAAAWGFVTGLTRPNGFLLSAALVLLVIDARRRPSIKELFAAAAPVAAVALYSAFIWQLTGHPLTWLSGHAAWGRHYQNLSDLVVSRYDFITHAGVAAYAEERPYDLLNGLGVLFVVISVWPVTRRFGLAYGAFILLNMLPALASGGFMSAGRVSSVMFPAFLWLASAAPAGQRAGWVALFAAMQAFGAALFYTWRPLY